jgi:hypothetical protein
MALVISGLTASAAMPTPVLMQLSSAWLIASPSIDPLAEKYRPVVIMFGFNIM